ncbi:hypothetical protein ACWGII_14075 [Streptomyces sp. NPDC054855]
MRHARLWPVKEANPAEPDEVLRDSESVSVEIPAGQRAAITEIVQAVREGEQWRIGVLLDRFVVDADLPALIALREALADAVSRQGEP